MIVIQTLMDGNFKLYLNYTTNTPEERRNFKELQSYRDQLMDAIAYYEIPSGNATTNINVYLTALKDGRTIPNEEQFVEDAFRDVQKLLYDASRGQAANVFGWTQISPTIS